MLDLLQQLIADAVTAGTDLQPSHAISNTLGSTSALLDHHHNAEHVLVRSYERVDMDAGARAGSFILSTFMMASFICNAVIVIATLRVKQLRTISNGLMLQLTIADGVLAGVIGPVIMKNFADGAWLNGMDDKSEWQASASMGACFMSIQALALIALHRYNVIVKSTQWTRSQTLWRCAPTWFLSLLLMAMSYFGVGEFQVEPGRIMAGYEWWARGTELVPSVVAFLTIAISTAVIARCYYKIWQFVDENTRQLNSTLNTKRSTAVKQAERSQNREIALAQRMAIIVGCFIGCWILYAIMILYCLISGNPQPVGLDRTATILGHSNSLINPILFTYLDKKIWIAVRALFTCKSYEEASRIAEVSSNNDSITHDQENTMLSTRDRGQSTVSRNTSFTGNPTTMTTAADGKPVRNNRASARMSNSHLNSYRGNNRASIGAGRMSIGNHLGVMLANGTRTPGFSFSTNPIDKRASYVPQTVAENDLAESAPEHKRINSGSIAVDTYEAASVNSYSQRPMSPSSQQQSPFSPSSFAMSQKGLVGAEQISPLKIDVEKPADSRKSSPRNIRQIRPSHEASIDATIEEGLEVVSVVATPIGSPLLDNSNSNRANSRRLAMKLSNIAEKNGTFVNVIPRTSRQASEELVMTAADVDAPKQEEQHSVG